MQRRKNDLNPRALAVLRVLCHRETPMPGLDLCKRADLSLETAPNILKAMVDGGLIEIQPRGTTKLYCITERGADALAFARGF